MIDTAAFATGTFNIVNDSLSADQSSMLADVLAGLGAEQKSIPPKYFYDEAGSQIFDEITQLEENYPTRAEAQIMQLHGAEIARTLGDDVLLVEYGSGSSIKTRILLDEMSNMAGYVPVDISGEYLYRVAETLRADYPQLPIHPLAADFTQAFDLPAETRKHQRRVVYFPGSTIGNFAPPETVNILRQMAQLFGDNGGALIGADLVKSHDVLVAAYNDARQVTARFNLNLLHRINRELGANFDVSQFRHQAVFDATEARIEMLLLANQAMDVVIAGRTFHFAADEAILTEYSHKYTTGSFEDLASQAGLKVAQVWTDPQSLFSVQYLTAKQ